ncbi:endonuclease [Pseudofulvibacter geojedonensis]|uniref:Endonuclease n=1 Tax=Pseudofulvibacter geojedonensis TaxID=1123758 RepID=A0ABW3HYZ9_9FLAO
MKKITLLLLMVGLVAQAQIPTGYYDHATGTGYTLKTQLKRIVNDANDPEITVNEYLHMPQSYSSLWTLYQTSDDRTDGYVWEVYSQCNFVFGTDQDSGTGGGTECDKYNREHTFPRSWYGDGSTHPMRADAFHVLPSDKKVNAERGNLAYGEVATANYTSNNGSQRGTSSIAGPTGQVFEPADEFKGDIARGLFYVAVRYEDEIATWETNDSDGDSMLDGSSNKVFEQWALDMLYSWHINDPVSQKEIDRNNDIYNHQNNRNPFIDNPLYVAQIWGSVLATEDFSNTNNEFSMFPNPLNNNILTIKNAQNSNVLIFDVLGKKVFEKTVLENTSRLNLSQLNNGMYFVQIENKNSSAIKKLIKK